jgi:hypothetical protein
VMAAISFESLLAYCTLWQIKKPWTVETW